MKKSVVILGPTACGKTKLAVHLASKFGGEIISVDSRQVYKFLEIGSGKDLNDYVIDGKKIPYHLIDVCSPFDEFNLFNYIVLYNQVFENIVLREKIPILCGGTGLYLSAILKRYQLTRADFSDWKESPYYEKTLEELREIALQKKIPLHNTTDWLDKDRLLKALIICDSEGEKISAKEANYLVIGLNIDPETNRKLIKERLYKRIREGMIEEVELLLKMGLTHEKLRFFGLEYRYISLYLNGELNKNDAIQKLYSAICDYAKRQRTWFRKMEKEGLKINWIKYYDFESAKKIAYDFLKGEKA